jgi:hypothetical protein
MAKILKSLRKISLVSLSSLFLIAPSAPVLAVSLIRLPQPSVEKNFQSIVKKFVKRRPVGLRNLASVALEPVIGQKDLKIVLETTPLPPLAPDSPSISFDSIASSLSEVSFEGEVRELEEDDITILSQSDNEYEGLYGIYSLPAPSAAQTFAGENWQLNPGIVQTTVLPKTDVIESNTIDNMGIFRPPYLKDILASDVTDPGNPYAAKVKKGVQVDQAIPRLNAENDSTLQLWPRTPFQLEISEELANLTSTNFVETEAYGSINVDINFAIMPKDVFLTVYDLSVDWVNTGGYSQNLRSNIDVITEYHREQQAKFESQVEKGTRRRLERQLEYQTKVQQGVSRQVGGAFKSRPSAYVTQPKPYRSGAIYPSTARSSALNRYQQNKGLKPPQLKGIGSEGR